MYEKFEIDGKIIKVKTEIKPEETGVIQKKDLEDTMDLKEVVEEINYGTN